MGGMSITKFGCWAIFAGENLAQKGCVDAIVVRKLATNCLLMKWENISQMWLKYPLKGRFWAKKGGKVYLFCYIMAFFQKVVDFLLFI